MVAAAQPFLRQRPNFHAQALAGAPSPALVAFDLKRCFSRSHVFWLHRPWNRGRKSSLTDMERCNVKPVLGASLAWSIASLRPVGFKLRRKRFDLTSKEWKKIETFRFRYHLRCGRHRTASTSIGTERFTRGRCAEDGMAPSFDTEGAKP